MTDEPEDNDEQFSDDLLFDAPEASSPGQKKEPISIEKIVERLLREKTEPVSAAKRLRELSYVYDLITTGVNDLVRNAYLTSTGPPSTVQLDKPDIKRQPVQPDVYLAEMKINDEAEEFMQRNEGFGLYTECYPKERKYTPKGLELFHGIAVHLGHIDATGGLTISGREYGRNLLQKEGDAMRHKQWEETQFKEKSEKLQKDLLPTALLDIFFQKHEDTDELQNIMPGTLARAMYHVLCYGINKTAYAFESDALKRFTREYLSSGRGD